MLSLPSLSSIYEIDRNFQKAKRLDADLDLRDLSAYQLNESGWHVLKGIADQIKNTKQRAFTITGPYGSGKSSLAIFLTAALSGDPALRSGADRLLGASRYEEFAEAFNCPPQGWMTIKVVGSRTDIVDAIFVAICSESEQFFGAQHGITDLAKKSGKTLPNLISVLKLISEELLKSGSGLLLIIDEMGKLLEYASQTGGDLFPLQEIAETFGRGAGNSVVIGILHQAFADYGRRAGDAVQAEWSKIQGRFVDFPFSIGLDEVVVLISSAIKASKTTTAEQAELSDRIANAFRNSANGGLAGALKKSIPLHPVTALLLGPVSRRRFGQNERSVFSFLCSYEPNGFMDFLQSEPATSTEYFTPAKFWEYLQTNHEPSILASPDGQRWAEAAEAVLRATHRPKSTKTHIEITKTIGLLDLFGKSFGLLATEELLNTCIDLPDEKPKKRGRPSKTLKSDNERKSLTTILNDLTDWSVAIPRRHAGAWGLFAGSDIDIDYELSKMVEKLVGDNNAVLSTLQDLPPVVAKRHFANTGTLRLFERKIVRGNEIENYLKTYDQGTGPSGTFTLILPETYLDGGQANLFIPPISKDNLAFVSTVQGKSRLIEAALEVAALERLPSVVPQLHGDAVARREVNARLLYAKAQLSSEIRHEFDEAIWNSEHLPPTKVLRGGLSVLASQLCDIVYHSTPRLHNELINRNFPSPTAGTARRKLLLAMLRYPNKDRLGIEGEPAELGLYLSLLRKTKLHRTSDDASQFEFVDPASDSSLFAAWEIALRQLKEKSENNEPYKIGDLYKLWRSPPFGMREGILPVFAYALMQAHRNELALYVDGNYVVSPDEFFIERLLDDVQSVSIGFVPADESIGDFIVSFNELNKRLGLFEGEAKTPLEVTKPFVQFMLKLHPWVKRTKRINQNSIKVRDAALGASDPYSLMLIDLPSAFNMSRPELLGSKEELESFFHKLGRCADELKVAYRALLRRFAFQIVKELGVNLSLREALKIVAERANALPKETTDLRLARFTEALKVSESEKSWIESICSLATNKPLRDWNDGDVDRCAHEITQLINRFQTAETLAIVKLDADEDISKLLFELRTEINKSSLETRQKRAALMLLINEINGDEH
jgi:hypothetical protein